jgi:hypothetical protein
VPELRIRGPYLYGRPIGNQNGVFSIVDWDSRGTEWDFFESTVSLNAKADFTDNVAAMIELYSYDYWGEDFRSNYQTGVDSRANTIDDVDLLQAYVDVDKTYDLPLRVRIGRQCLKFGKGFLVDDKVTPTQRLSFDAIRLTYTPTGDITVDAWMSKLAENFSGDSDVDFYGVYGTYTGIKPLSLSAYWMLVRDARNISETTTYPLYEWLEKAAGVDNYGVTQLNTVGVRAWGATPPWDYDLELAYQFGEAGQHGALAVPVGGLYGDQDAQYDNWAADLEVGYTLDMKWQPRLFAGGAYFEGHDSRDISFGDWLAGYVNPFYHGESSVSFNRMFSNINYAPALQDNAWMSNFKQLRTGVTIKPSSKIWMMFRFQKLWAVDTFDWPVNVDINGVRVPVAPLFSWWTQPSSDDLGYSTDIIFKYNYSQDLTLVLYWGHLFTGPGLYDGNYIFFNGTGFAGGSARDQADYAFFWIINRF